MNTFPKSSRNPYKKANNPHGVATPRLKTTDLKYKNVLLSEH